MCSIEQVAAQIVETVRNAPGQTILGTQLADSLRRTVAFDPELHGKLRDVIALHTPSIKKLRPHGGDWYYGLATAVEHGTSLEAAPLVTEDQSMDKGVVPIKELDLAALQQAVNGPIWKTYASPAGPYRLVGNPKTGELMVIPPGTPLPEAPWIPIPSCSTSEHVEIAQAFIAQLSDASARTTLQQMVEHAGSGPTSGFYKEVITLGLTQEWNLFRKEKIVEHLAAALRSAGIGFRSTARPTQLRHPAQAITRYPHKAVPMLTLDVHNVAVAAVQKMSEAELRNLCIPLGYVIDIIGSR